MPCYNHNYCVRTCVRVCVCVCERERERERDREREREKVREKGVKGDRKIEGRGSGFKDLQ